MNDKPNTIEYCFVCLIQLTANTGRVLLRPLKSDGARTTIPLADQRVTMCQKHADAAVKARRFAVVTASDKRITG